MRSAAAIAVDRGQALGSLEIGIFFLESVRTLVLNVCPSGLVPEYAMAYRHPARTTSPFRPLRLRDLLYPYSSATKQ